MDGAAICFMHASMPKHGKRTSKRLRREPSELQERGEVGNADGEAFSLIRGLCSSLALPELSLPTASTILSLTLILHCLVDSVSVSVGSVKMRQTS